MLAEVGPVLRVATNTQNSWSLGSIDNVLQELLGKVIGLSDIAKEVDGIAKPGELLVKVAIRSRGNRVLD